MDADRLVELLQNLCDELDIPAGLCVEFDNDGQLVIYTGLMEVNGNLETFVSE